MKKKKKFILLTLILILVLSGYIIPIAVVNNLTNVTLINPFVVEVVHDIHVAGEVKEVDVSQVVTALPLVPSDILVKVGDTVTANQTLATVDKSATTEAIINFANTVITASAYIPDLTGALDLFENSGINFEYENSKLVNSTLSSQTLSNQVEKVTSSIPSAIKATTEGVVTSLDLVKGSMTMPQEIVCTISKTDQLYVQLEIGESNINQVAVGDNVIFKAIATEHEKYTGTITTIFPTASKVYQGTTQKTIVGAYVELDEVYENLKPNYNVTGVVKNSTTQAMVLPYETVQQDGDNNEYVYLYEDGRAVKQIITTGQELPQGVEVLTGVTLSSVVIANSSQVKSAGSIVIG